MVYHRSIVRIRRNENRKGGFNICAWLCCFILLNVIFYDFWVYINTIMFLIAFIAWFNYILKKKKQQQLQLQLEQQLQQQQEVLEENSFPQIENDYSSSHDIITIDADFMYDDAPITAVPISPSNQYNNDEITVVATQI